MIATHAVDLTTHQSGRPLWLGALVIALLVGPQVVGAIFFARRTQVTSPNQED